VSITISGCNSGGGGGESEGGAPPPPASPISGTLTVRSDGSSMSGVSLTYQGTCISGSGATATTTPIPSSTFASVGIGTYQLGNGGGN
jgi:hypothetical protein